MAISRIVSEARRAIQARDERSFRMEFARFAEAIVKEFADMEQQISELKRRLDERKSD